MRSRRGDGKPWQRPEARAAAGTVDPPRTAANDAPRQGSSISRIRAVIEDDPKNPKRVLTVRGSGYVFARKQDE